MTKGRNRIAVKSISGTKTAGMKHHIEGCLNAIVIHCGTNDLRSQKIPREIAEEIVTLENEAKQSVVRVFISNLTVRGDEFNEKANKVNDELIALTEASKLLLIDNNNIKSKAC